MCLNLECLTILGKHQFVSLLITYIQNAVAFLPTHFSTCRAEVKRCLQTKKKKKEKRKKKMTDPLQIVEHRSHQTHQHVLAITDGFYDVTKNSTTEEKVQELQFSKWQVSQDRPCSSITVRPKQENKVLISHQPHGFIFCS